MTPDASRLRRSADVPERRLPPGVRPSRERALHPAPPSSRSRVAGLPAALAFALGLSACLGEGTSPTSTASFRVTIPDPAGDAVIDARVPVSPDLLELEVRIERDTFFVVADYASGTDMASTYLAVSIDSDGSLITGRDVDGHGVDFVVASGAGTTPASRIVVLRYNGAAFFPTANPVPLEISGTRLTARVPLFLLGGLDGRGFMTVRGSTHAWIEEGEGEWSPVLDYAPDEEEPPALVQ